MKAPEGFEYVTRVDEEGEEHQLLVMTEEGIKERAEMNIRNTTEAQRKWVLEELAKRNGHSSNGKHNGR